MLKIALFRYLKENNLQGKYLQVQLMFLISMEHYRLFSHKLLLWLIIIRSKKHPVARKEYKVIEHAGITRMKSGIYSTKIDFTEITNFINFVDP